MRLLLKDAFIKVKKAYGRFLSVLFIVALGVGFFAGLRETASDMLLTADTYYDNYKLMDYKIVSTLGLTNDDVQALKKLKNIISVIPSHSVDVLSDGESIRVHAIEKNINKLWLVAGRMPKKANECVAEAKKYKVGDIITVERNDLNKYLINNKYTVVGTVNSALYVGPQKGIAGIGNGKLESFIFVTDNNFLIDYYTEIYLIAKNTTATNTYSDEYLKYINILKKELTTLKPIRETVRYEEVYEKTFNEINKIIIQTNNEKKAAQLKLANTKKELDDNKKLLDQGAIAIQNAIAVLAQSKVDNELLISNGRASIANGLVTYQNTLLTYGLSEETLPAAIFNLNNIITNLEATLLTQDIGTPEYNQTLSLLSSNKMTYQSLITLQSSKKNLDEQTLKLNTQEKQLIKEINANQAKIDEQQAELLINQKKLKDGYNQYWQGVNTLKIKLDDAESKINEAEKALNALEKPNWYLLTRNDSMGYSVFKDNAVKVDAIAQVFPLFFILVVALICLNTMARMIEEERTEIGILQALGYSNLKIVSSYIFYVLIATVCGVTLGLLVGYNLIPKTIYSIYTANYILPELIIALKALPFISIILSSFILMSLVTVYVCYQELKNEPATLLRPKAPKKGKTVLLERVDFVWKRLNFTGKVTTRNLFRYKKRIVMTILGIAGCMALLLTGFGLKDGVTSIVKLQYGGIIKYDAAFILNDKQQKIDTNTSTLLKNNDVKDQLLINQELYSFTSPGRTNDAYLIVTSNNKELNKFIELKSTTTHKTITINDDGVLISAKMARLLNVSIGGNIKVRDSNNKLYILRVNDIVENYTWHYIYMSDKYYEKTFKQKISYNIIIGILKDGTNESKVADNVLKSKTIGSINFISDNYSIFDEMVKGLNKIVYLMIICACLLAFIVLYNLTTININERTREIATLKVLGFRDKEVSSYVYREIFILTLLGMGVGLFLGVLLHRYVMFTAETDNIMFTYTIRFRSFIYSVILTIIFSYIVQIFTYFRLKKVDMIESLKSVE